MKESLIRRLFSSLRRKTATFVRSDYQWEEELLTVVVPPERRGGSSTLYTFRLEQAEISKLTPDQFRNWVRAVRESRAKRRRSEEKSA
ncbi:MAG TPA: hypothetical protein VGH33_02420 [Isosphaeraceae bacterium]|jgi:hypothetical protein